MTKPVKAVLLSALVFPGCGQLWLRHYRTAAVLLAVTIGALIIVINDAMQKASVIASQILAGDMPLDPQSISTQVAAITSGDDSMLVNGALWVLGICWLLGIADAYRIAREPR